MVLGRVSSCQGGGAQSGWRCVLREIENEREKEEGKKDKKRGRVKEVWTGHSL